MGEGDGSTAASAGSGEWTAGALGKMGDIDCDGLGSRSSVIQVEILSGWFSMSIVWARCSRNALEPVEKSAARIWNALKIRAAVNAI
jgi:hypothetical protein